MAKQVTEADYRVVQATMNPFPDPKVAQEFVDAIDFGEDRNLISAPRYTLVAPGDQMMRFDSVTEDLHFYPTSFMIKDLAIFMNCAKYHEIHHARQIRLHLQQMARLLLEGRAKYVYGLTEIPAYLNQVGRKTDFTLPPELETRILEQAIPRCEKIIEHEKRFRDWKADLSSLLCPSPLDDIVRERYGL